MCGIAGIYSTTNSEFDCSAITLMGQTMHHRGPDNFSTYCAEHVALAHNRLSIIDLSDSANQPFADERYALTYNGEIYNYLELKRDLDQFAIDFRSTSDTEFFSTILLLWNR